MALAVYGATKIPLQAFEEGIAHADTNGNVLVSIFFDGGIDSMSLLAPTGHSRYSTLRPTLAMGPTEGTPFTDDPSLRWHPSASPLATLHAEGKVSVFPAIGYTSPNQSHFTSRHFYEIGELVVGARTGWLGRYIDRTGDENNPLQGLSIDGSLSPALATANMPVAAVWDPTDFDMWTRGTGEWVDPKMFQSFGRFGTHGGPAELRPHDAGPAGDQADQRPPRAAQRLQRLPDPAGLPGHELRSQARGSGRADRRSAAPQLRHGERPRRVRHALRSGVLVRRTTSQTRRAAILAFQRDLENRGLDRKVLMEVWSEFGRRPDENGSAGTDHGAAGCGFVIGTRAKGDMIGEFPGLTSLDPDDNLLVTSDFRSMYCTLLEDWLGEDATGLILGEGSMPRYDLIDA